MSAMNTPNPTASTVVRSPAAILKQVFGYSEFRDGQETVINAARFASIAANWRRQISMLPSARACLKRSDSRYFAINFPYARSSITIASARGESGVYQ